MFNTSIVKTNYVLLSSSVKFFTDKNNNHQTALSAHGIVMTLQGNGFDWTPIAECARQVPSEQSCTPVGRDQETDQ